MNPSQATWWRQARSDLDVLRLLRRNAVAPCHQLHYLQMAGEKIAKAYFWRTGAPPAKKHAGLVSFLKALGGTGGSRQALVAATFEFREFKQFQTWIRHVSPRAYDLEKLAPALAGDGPNPEYPWPHDAPVEYPAGYRFDLWKWLGESGSGRQFSKVVEIAVDRFPIYA